MDTGLAPRPSHVPENLVVDFDVWAPPGAEIDFHAAWETLRRPGTPDLVWTPRNGGHWIATRLKPMAEAFEDYKRFSSRVLIVPKEIGEKFDWIPTTVDPPQHRPFRVLLNSSFAPKTINTYEHQIRDLVVELIESFRAKGQCDFQAEFADQLPIRLFMHLLELPSEDARQIKHWSDQVTRLEGTLTMEEMTEKFFSYLSPVYDARVGKDGTDILSRLMNGQIGDRKITKLEALSLCTQVVQAGLDTVVNMLGFAIVFLARNAGHRAQLIADPSLIPAAVDEIFRRYPIVMNGREIVQDTELAGIKLKAGEVLVMPTPLSGTDDRENADPLTVDFQRDHRASLTFGGGSHRCPGAPLARLELQVTLEEWMKRIPEFQIAPGARLKYKPGVTPVVDAIPLVWDVAATETALRPNRT